jgi:iron only hydrogenase large subunit-like protein
MNKSNKPEHFHHALKIVREACIGCFHCMSICPTEAIRVKNGKAELLEHKCVDCGFCFRVCPVNAIIVEQDDFNRIFEYKARVALVPAVMIGQFPEDISTEQIYSEIMELGFTHVFEVEHGVDVLHPAQNKYLEDHADTRPMISSFCPAVVRLIQVKFPALLENMVHLKAPLDISAMYYRKQLIDQGLDSEDIGIFYITPCAAKIAAVKSPVGDDKSDITGVINLDFMFNKVYTRIKQSKASSCIVPQKKELSSKNILWSLTNGEVANTPGRCLAIDEIHNVIEFLEKLENEEMQDIDFLELRACDESCAGGVLATSNRFFIVERLRKRAAETDRKDAWKKDSPEIEDYEGFLKRNIGLKKVKPRSMMKLDEDMAEAMKKLKRVQEISKSLPDVDCGVCGSPSCRAFAEDIVQGDAVINQCIFVQRIFEKKGILSTEESLAIMKKVWGSEKLDRNC